MSKEIEYFSHSTVRTVSSLGSDADVVQAARVSVRGANEVEMGDKERGLIRFLMQNEHASPFEHVVAKFYCATPIVVVREWMRHRTLCLAADTRILFQTEAGNGFLKDIATHYDHWHNGVPDSMGRRRKLPSVYKARVRSFDESTLAPCLSAIKDVVKSEDKPVFTLTTSRGFQVTASLDHLIFTDDGWQKLGELTKWDEVYVQRKAGKNTGKLRAVSHTLRQGIQEWVSSVKSQVFESCNETCQNCGIKSNNLRCDHIIPVALDLSKALDINNLQALCESCDRKKTNSEQYLARRPKKFDTVSLDGIKSIVLRGFEPTYDLVLEGPNHNFLGNGVIVHNSYNEVSGRYKELEPRFYIPQDDRPLIQEGKPGGYTFALGDRVQEFVTRLAFQYQSEAAWDTYQHLLDSGIAKEVARMVLPLNLMTEFYVTGNLRNWLNFLSLRTAPDAMFEIREAAGRVEEALFKVAPVTLEMWDRLGRKKI